MLYISADDYGLTQAATEHIKQCIERGALNKVSAFPNMDKLDLQEISKDAMLCLHLNLVEGKCMANPADIDLLCDKDGNFKNAFGGLFKLSLLKPKKFKEQVYREIRAQVLFWKSVLPEGCGFCIDGHQHTHMIPAVFKALLNVLDEENIPLKYIRIPREPILPYVKTPSLYFTYSAVNVIKQWLLNFLWLFNKRAAKRRKLPTALFMGILFSGKMDDVRVGKILPKYKKLAAKKKMDIEILFHPGYLEGNEADFAGKNIPFEKFYLSQNRKTEFDSVIKISQFKK